MGTAKPKRRKVKKKSDLQILNEARLSAGLPPRLDMPERDYNFWPTHKPGQKVSRKKFPKQKTVPLIR